MRNPAPATRRLALLAATGVILAALAAPTHAFWGMLGKLGSSAGKVGASTAGKTAGAVGAAGAGAELATGAAQGAKAAGAAGTAAADAAGGASTVGRAALHADDAAPGLAGAGPGKGMTLAPASDAGGWTFMADLKPSHVPEGPARGLLAKPASKLTAGDVEAMTAEYFRIQRETLLRGMKDRTLPGDAAPAAARPAAQKTAAAERPASGGVPPYAYELLFRAAARLLHAQREAQRVCAGPGVTTEPGLADACRRRKASAAGVPASAMPK